MSSFTLSSRTTLTTSHKVTSIEDSLRKEATKCHLTGVAVKMTGDVGVTGDGCVY